MRLRDDSADARRKKTGLQPGFLFNAQRSVT
jgi:hypothetical protein